MGRAKRRRRRLKKRTVREKLSAYIKNRALRAKYPRYITTTKAVGETPLVATERARIEYSIPTSLPLSYAGRLDPMASGKLLVLVGDECKKQEKYHGLDKEYRVEMLLGIASDTGDVLGTISECAQKILTLEDIQSVCTALTGKITLSYPHFSAKTVRGKPLHTWTLEGRLDEIEIPQKTSRIYRLHVDESRIVRKDDLVADVRKKIETIPPVTDPRKHLGADFRRADVRASWTQLEHEGLLTYQIVTFTCIASSGTYMRSLCEHIARKLGTCALAYSIHRTTIGTYMPIGRRHGFWAKKY